MAVNSGSTLTWMSSDIGVSGAVLEGSVDVPYFVELDKMLDASMAPTTGAGFMGSSDAGENIAADGAIFFLADVAGAE